MKRLIFYIRYFIWYYFREIKIIFLRPKGRNKCFLNGGLVYKVLWLLFWWALAGLLVWWLHESLYACVDIQKSVVDTRSNS